MSGMWFKIGKKQDKREDKNEDKTDDSEEWTEIPRPPPNLRLIPASKTIFALLLTRHPFIPFHATSPGAPERTPIGVQLATTSKRLPTACAGF